MKTKKTKKPIVKSPARKSNKVKVSKTPNKKVARYLRSLQYLVAQKTISTRLRW